ncbi:MAG: undecaprenyldiphospho-muramoylpentapeptide beta-N-acetylglucosaminyltransferase [Acidobacteriota bacterium]
MTGSPRTERPTRGSTPLALIAGGGSGGHVFPGLAVAEELLRRGWDVAWVGVPNGMERRLVRRRGLEFHALKAKPLLGRGLVGKAKALATLFSAGLAGRSLVRRLGASVVLGTGGYVSAPAVLGARLAGVPTLLLEPNAEAGVANRALSRFAREAMVAHPTTASGLRCPVTVTGVPVRAEFFDIAEDLPWGSATRMLVLGGSQGAAQLNRLLPRALKLVSERCDELGQILVRHQTGERHLETAGEAYAGSGIETVMRGLGFKPDGDQLQVELSSFLNNVSGAMAESHLIVSRAGAITLAEVCAAGRPTLLAPLSIAAGHQVQNAERLAEAGASKVFIAKGEDEDAQVEELASALLALLEDRRGLTRMAEAARALGRPDAASDIADRVEHCSGERPRAPHAVALYAPAVAASQLGGLLPRASLEAPRATVTPNPSSSGFVAFKSGGGA